MDFTGQGDEAVQHWCDTYFETVGVINRSSITRNSVVQDIIDTMHALT